jgi:uncharacterized protein YaaW (UPF0174 family)
MKNIEKLINHYKVVTIENLKNTLNTDYSMTVFRYRKGIGYLSSYNIALLIQNAAAQSVLKTSTFAS